MLADYLSNYIQHPTQKMDYGIFNKLIGREVDQVIDRMLCLPLYDYTHKLHVRRQHVSAS